MASDRELLKVTMRQRPLGANPIYWASNRTVPCQHWAIKTVGDLATTFKGKLPSELLDKPTEMSLPYLLMEGLRGGDHVFTENTSLPSVTETDTIVIADGSKSGFAVRGVAGVLGSTLLGFQAKEGVDSSYLYHTLTSLFAFLNSATTGTAIPHLDQNLLLKLPLAIPPPAEQAAIARILDAADAAIERTRDAIERARAVKESLIQQLFTYGIRGEPCKKTRIGLIPASWEVVPVEAVALKFEYGLSVPMQLTGEVPILRMGNIQQGEIILEDLKYVTLPPKLTDPYLCRRGDVFFNRTNSQEHVGKVGIYRSDEPSVFASYLIRVVPNPEVINNYFLGQLLNSYGCQCRIKRYATPGVQQVNINATNLGKVLLPLPVGISGVKEQEEIAAILEKADSCIHVRQPVLERQIALKQSLMHDLLTGKARVRAEQQLKLFEE